MSKIAIIGGGMVGLAQAIALASKGVAVTVIEKAKLSATLEKSFDGRTAAIAYRSYKFLDSIGAWADMEKHGQPINDIRVADDGSSLFAHFDHSEIGDEPFGYIIENRYIRHALINRARALKNIMIKDDVTLKAIPQGYDLVIAADGKFSKTREMAGIKTHAKSYKQTGIVCTIEHEIPHQGLAVEKFLPAGPFAVLPMKGNKSSLVWTEPNDLAPIYMKMSDADFLAEIGKRCDWLGELKLVQGRWSYPLSLSHAKTYIADKLALVGDAAHGIHPIAGQGVNLGFRDVEELTEIIVNQLKLGLTAGNGIALEEYEEARKFDNSKMIRATDSLNMLFSNNILPIKVARSMGLGLVNEIAPLKKFFMKQAAGKN